MCGVGFFGSFGVTRQQLCWNHCKTELGMFRMCLVPTPWRYVNGWPWYTFFNKQYKILTTCSINNRSRLHPDSFSVLRRSTSTHINYTWVSHISGSQVYRHFHAYLLHPDIWSNSVAPSTTTIIIERGKVEGAVSCISYLMLYQVENYLRLFCFFILSWMCWFNCFFFLNLLLINSRESSNHNSKLWFFLFKSNYSW